MDELDREEFRRVWGRVMPEDRADCPFTLDPPETAERGGPPMPPLMGPVSAPAVPPFVAPPAPQMPGRPPQLPVCLGAASRRELPTLEELLARTARDSQAYQALVRRWPRETLFRELARTKSRQVRKLRAVWYLIEGKPWVVPALGSPTPASLPQALRERHRAEQETASALLTAAGESADPCLAGVYRELAKENRALARRIRTRLERVG